MLGQGRLLLMILGFTSTTILAAELAPPEVRNVTANQDPGTNTINIRYDLFDAENDTVTVSAYASLDAGVTFPITCVSATGDIGEGIAPASGLNIMWDAGQDVPGLNSSACSIRVLAESTGPVVPENAVLIPAGTFTMGSPAGEADRGADEQSHPVTLSRPIFMMNTEVTQSAYQGVMGTNPSYFTSSDTCPVDCVTWYDAIDYCNALSVAQGLQPAYTGQAPEIQWQQSASGWRLPTEAEWEYACRAATITPFHTGECLDADLEANYRGLNPYTGCAVGVHRGETLPVGSFSPNAWGLHDMHGNLWEWCWDGYADYPSGAITDPVGEGSNKVRRGGSWYNYGHFARSACRQSSSPGNTSYNIGFRVVRWAD
jgi:formylglycine-generating enzyme required for sulfatase activity